MAEVFLPAFTKCMLICTLSCQSPVATVQVGGSGRVASFTIPFTRPDATLPTASFYVSCPSSSMRLVMSPSASWKYLACSLSISISCSLVIVGA
jgi:hypothetical protein